MLFLAESRRCINDSLGRWTQRARLKERVGWAISQQSVRRHDLRAPLRGDPADAACFQGGACKLASAHVREKHLASR